jgi:hypothetical protein
VEKGLFYTGQSLTRIPERDVADLPTAAEILEGLEARLAEDGQLSAGAAAH